MDSVGTEQLLKRAANGDQFAWDALVDRYARLVWSVVIGYRLDQAATEDVYQTVWLRLVEHLDRITQPERLAGWLATTTRNEALRVLRLQRRAAPTEDLGVRDDPTVASIEEMITEAETHGQVVAAFGRLSLQCQELLRLLTVDPPLDYATVAEMIGRPIGSLGPTRARCLEKLRAFLDEDTA